MRDFLSRSVRVGDYIMHSTTGRYPETFISLVTRLTEKTIFAKPIQSNRSYSHKMSDDELRVQNTFLIVNEEMKK